MIDLSARAQPAGGDDACRVVDRNAEDDELLDNAGAAAVIKHAPSTLCKWRVTGQGPEFVKIGRRVLYQKRKLKEWASARRFRSTSEYG